MKGGGKSHKKEGGESIQEHWGTRREHGREREGFKIKTKLT